MHIYVTVYMCICNWTRTQNHLVLKRTLNHLAKLECGFTLKRVRDMTRTYSHFYSSLLISFDFIKNAQKYQSKYFHQQSKQKQKMFGTFSLRIKTIRFFYLIHLCNIATQMQIERLFKNKQKCIKIWLKIKKNLT